MRYLLPALLLICLVSLSGPAIGFEWEDPFCDNPDWTNAPPQPGTYSTTLLLPTAFNRLIVNNFALPLDEHTSLAFNYGPIGPTEQSLNDDISRTEPAFSIGLRCLFD